MTRAKSPAVNLFETGLYSVRDVAQLTRAHPTRVSRWVKGYSYPSPKGRKHQEPLWEPEVPPLEGTITLSFNDLLEILFVHEFRKEGLSLAKIRSTVRALRRETSTKYPFSNRMIFTDGKELFEKLQDDDGKPLFVQLSTKRKPYSFFHVTLPYLRKGMIFDDRGVVRRWFPDKKNFSSIVVDPMISFGRPVIDGTRLNTSVLASAASAKHSIESVADWFGIDSGVVQEAVSFHQKYKAA